ncbi:hypothetical protein AURDEDRAFT_168882 [Auricularia subglabra TFB-10046 SS5]|nr:hypothetical protein AURDEDRAFT_168882 [Auricularia subglabra TFB-10046 SS5]
MGVEKKQAAANRRKAAKHRNAEIPSSNRKLTSDRTGPVWPDWTESIVAGSFATYKLVVEPYFKKIKGNGRSGQNKWIADDVYRKTGLRRTSRQVSSHLQQRRLWFEGIYGNTVSWDEFIVSKGVPEDSPRSFEVESAAAGPAPVECAALLREAEAVRAMDRPNDESELSVSIPVDAYSLEADSSNVFIASTAPVIAQNSGAIDVPLPIDRCAESFGPSVTPLYPTANQATLPELNTLAVADTASLNPWVTYPFSGAFGAGPLTTGYCVESFVPLAGDAQLNPNVLSHPDTLTTDQLPVLTAPAANVLPPSIGYSLEPVSLDAIGPWDAEEPALAVAFSAPSIAPLARPEFYHYSMTYAQMESVCAHPDFRAFEPRFTDSNGICRFTGHM